VNTIGSSSEDLDVMFGSRIGGCALEESTSEGFMVLPLGVAPDLDVLVNKRLDTAGAVREIADVLANEKLDIATLVLGADDMMEWFEDST
jgi:hypothetical protein